MIRRLRPAPPAPRARSVAGRSLALLSSLLLAASCGGGRGPAGSGAESGPPPAAEYAFTEVTETAGVANAEHNHFGATWSDYDGDGRLDLYVVNDDTNTLYRNLGDGRFEDVTAATGAGDPWFAMRNVWADYDRDGDLDFYSHNFLQSTLYMQHRGVFYDVNAFSGAGLNMPNGTGAGWADYDNDGWLDLHACGFSGLGNNWNVLFHNNGDGTFTDLQPESGISYEGESMGQAWADYDNDGDLDLALAAVTMHYDHWLYRNNGDGTFTHVSVEAGITAAIEEGSSGAAVCWGDYDNDGWLDLVLTEVLLGSVKTEPERVYLFRNQGDGTFQELSVAAGIAPGPAIFDFWEAGFFDWDNDGDLDLFLGAEGPNLFYRNNGDGTFTDIAPELGLDFPEEGKGVVFGDYDDDGDLDLYLVQRLEEEPFVIPCRLFRNEGGSNHWLQVELQGTLSNLDAIGTRVLVRAGGRSQIRELHAGRGLFSQDSPVLQFGLGPAATAASVTVRFPSGRILQFHDVAADQRLLAVEP